MQRPIELFALLDYIKLVIKYQEYRYLTHEPFETIFISYSDEPVISSINREIINNNFIDALNQIHSYEQGNSQFHNVYMSIKKDYFSMGSRHTTGDMTNLLQDKYGIMHGEEMMALLDLQASLIETHELT
jgi:hypothetical protein